jgi:hypothetical protein
MCLCTSIDAFLSNDLPFFILFNLKIKAEYSAIFVCYFWLFNWTNKFNDTNYSSINSYQVSSMYKIDQDKDEC